MMFYVAQFTEPRVQVINALLKKKDRSERWLAEKLEVTHYSIGKWLDTLGGNPPRDRALYDRMIEILRADKGVRDVSVEVTGMREVLVYMAGLPGGPPESRLADTEPILFPYSGDPEDELYGRPITGESMSAVLKPHDIAVLKKVDRADSGDVVHIYHDGEEAIKCLRTIGGDPWAFSFNEEFDAFEAENWRVRGLCVGRIRTGQFKVRQFTEFPGGLKWSMRTIDL